jgi:hypothetical protein
MGYYLNKNVDPKEHYLKMTTRSNSRKKFSRFRGVTKSGNLKKPYAVTLTFQGKRHFLGHYETELEAARVYNEKAPIIIGDFAILNDLEGVNPQ